MGITDHKRSGVVPTTDTPTVSLYLLSDPRDGVPRYVGQTRDPFSRYQSHISTARHDVTGKKSAVERWIHALVAEGQHPALTVVAIVRADVANDLEQGLIAHYGDTILNHHKPRPSRWTA